MVSVMHQGVCLFDSAPPVVVVAQKWPCWLYTALSLGLTVVGGFFGSRFHSYFPVPDTCKLKSWFTVEDLPSMLSQFLDNAVILASGTLNFLGGLEHWSPSRVMFSVDVYFPKVGL
jgi:hypothetical protein